MTRKKIFIYLAYRNSTNQFIELSKSLKKKYKIYCLVFGYENFTTVQRNKSVFEKIYSYEKLVNNFYKNKIQVDKKKLKYQN